MTKPPDQTAGALTPRRIVLQVAGFAVGIALLAWCIRTALGGGDGAAEIRQRLLDAPPLLLVGLVGASVASLVINGLLFWNTLRPARRLSWIDLQWINLAANLLNLAPVRLGAITRIVHHHRNDRVPILQIGAWFAALAALLAVSLAGAFAATIIRPQLDAIWVALLLGLTATGGLCARLFVAHPLIAKHGRGLDRMLAAPGALWGGLALRTIDLGAYVARMACAVAILGLDLPARHIVILAIVALTASLIPAGRVGFREWTVALVASRLAASGIDGAATLDGGALDAHMAQLALIESAGEAVVLLPFGAVALLWLRRRWRTSRPTEAQNSPAEPPA